MYDFVSKKYWFFLISIVIMVVGVVFVALGGIEPGIEFDGGLRLRLHFDNEAVTQGQLEEALVSYGHDDALVQKLEDHGQFTVHIKEPKTIAEENALMQYLTSELGEVTVESRGIVSPLIASETVRNAAIAVVIAALAILLYVTFAFRKMPNPFRYGVCGIVALVHDVLITVGVFAILGFAFNWEVNPMFVTAVLAVIGYSVNDTIVVFDRIRENQSRGTSSDFQTTVNISLTQTLARSLCTSITTVVVVSALYLFVGGDIRNFVVTLLIGVLAGTYSSIFIASQLLVVWEEDKWRKYVPAVPVLKKLRA